METTTRLENEPLKSCELCKRPIWAIWILIIDGEYKRICYKCMVKVKVKGGLR